MQLTPFVILFLCFIVRVEPLHAKSSPELPFKLYVTFNKLKFKERYGTFKVKNKIKDVCYAYKILREGEDRYRYEFPTCDFDLILKRDGNSFSFSPLWYKNPSSNRQAFLHLLFPKAKKEHFFGLGTQYSHLRLNGHKIPILSQEQGNGRGLQPLTFFQRIFSNGIQGHEFSTGLAKPLVLSSNGQAVSFQSHHYMEADFTHEKSFVLSHHTLTGQFKVTQKENLKSLLPTITKWQGKQKALPDWIHKGAILGLMGGTKKVTDRVEELKDSGSALGAVWLQDWVGQQQTFLGPRLQWNWRIDRETYPQWEVMVDRFSKMGLPVLGYFNPYLTVDIFNPLYNEALLKGYLVKEEGEVLEIKMGGFKAVLVNLLDKSAYRWLKNIMVKNVKEARLKGWMADFGEAYPMYSHNSARHHQYIEAWQKLNKEVREEFPGKELISFHRSGGYNSNKFVDLFWLGDQTATYDGHDGLKTTVRGLLSSGLGGIAYNHSDIGGYFGIKIPLLYSLKRTKKLLKRWMEVNAFTMIFRTHLGLRPEILYQVDQDEEIKKEFARWSHQYQKLFSYRKHLIKDYEKKSLPPVRPLFLHYPDEPETYKIEDQFLFGEKYLVAPIYKDFSEYHRVYLPKGSWEHLWNHERFQSKGEYFLVKVHQNTSPVFLKI